MLFFFHTLLRTLWQLFVRSLIQRFSNHNYSLHTQRVFIQDWLNSYWIHLELPLPELSCLLYRRVSSLINAREEECRCLREISINVNKLVIVICVFCLHLSLKSCCCLFIPFLYCTVVCLFISLPLFYTDVVAKFLFIRWSCKQAHYFLFLKLLFIILITPFPFS